MIEREGRLGDLLYYCFALSFSVCLNRQSGVECGDELVERPLDLGRLLVVVRLRQDAVELRVRDLEEVHHSNTRYTLLIVYKGQNSV